MVARRSLGARFRFLNAEWICWRCALKSTHQYKAILQQSTTIVPEIPRKCGIQKASQDPLATDRVVAQLESLSRPVKKNRAYSTESSRSSLQTTPEESLASTVRDPPNVVTRRGSHLSLRRRGKYYTTSALRNAVSDVEATPRVHGHSTPPFNQQSIREHLRLWQQQLKPQANSSSTAEEINSPRAMHNSLQQGVDDSQKIVGDKEDGEVSSLTDGGIYLRPGDVVGFWQGRDPILAVFTQRFINQDQFYTMQGRWVHTNPGDPKFAVARLIEPEDLHAIIPYLPNEELPIRKLLELYAMPGAVPREAGANLIRKMLRFHNSAGKISKKYARRLLHIHRIIAHPTQRSHASLHEIAMKVLNIESRASLTDSMLWAVHQALVQEDYCRLETIHHRSRPMFDIMSTADAINIEKVKDWFRGYQEQAISHNTGIQEPARTRHLRNPVLHFIKKCRKIIHDSRSTRETNSGSIGPSCVRIEPTEPDWAVWKSSRSIRFDRDESNVLRFLQAWTTTGWINHRSSTLFATGSKILRAIGMYKNLDLGQPTGFLLLKELGIIPPWLNRGHYIPGLPLPFHDVDPQTDNLQLQAEESVAEFHIEDSMKDLRRDWGDLEVFCIDRADAREIDDGLSLEEIDESTFWVHIHVANPSAFLAPSSAIGRNAAHRVSTMYLPDGAYPILPEAITLPHFSLGNNRPCITFSAQVTLDGDVVETQISHGILHNVRYFTYEDVDDVLGREQETEVQQTNLTVGGTMPAMPAMPATRKTTSMSSSHRRLLRRLHELSQARTQKKTREGALSYPPKWKCEPKVYLGPKRDFLTGLRTRYARQFEGDPIISLEMRPSEHRFASSSGEMVGTLMTLAGEIGAMWCSKRNIPIAYRGNLCNPDPLESPEQFRQKHLDPLIAKKEKLPAQMVHYYTKMAGKMATSAVPLRHLLLGAAVYCRLTSPLRRFTDLMTHWQIEAAIRQESRTGTSLIGGTDDESYLAFSRRETEILLRAIAVTETAIRRAERTSFRHWITQFLFRAFHHKEAPLPERFNVVVEEMTYFGKYFAWMRELGITFTIGENVATALEGGIRVGDVWEVRISNIDCYTSSTFAEALQLVERPNVEIARWNRGGL